MKARMAGLVLATVGAAVLLMPVMAWGGQQLAQMQLRRQYAAAPAAVAPVAVPPAPVQVQPPAPAAPPAGQPAFRLDIPAIGLQAVVVEGVDDAQLTRASGHYPDTPMPGPGGNAVIAGHRTISGLPSFFYKLDRLKPGDQIRAAYPDRVLTYAVTRVFITDAQDLTVLAPTPEATLTLTTCDPPGAAARRLVVTAGLIADTRP